MAWYDKILGRTQEDLEEKLNPAQFHLGKDIESSREHTFSYERAYEEIEVVNRGVNMIVDDVSEIPTLVSRENSFRGVTPGVKASKVGVKSCPNSSVLDIFIYSTYGGSTAIFYFLFCNNRCYRC